MPNGGGAEGSGLPLTAPGPTRGGAAWLRVWIRRAHPGTVRAGQRRARLVVATPRALRPRPISARAKRRLGRSRARCPRHVGKPRARAATLEHPSRQPQLFPLAFPQLEAACLPACLPVRAFQRPNARRGFASGARKGTLTFPCQGARRELALPSTASLAR